jgi:hypothetical protein
VPDPGVLADPDLVTSDGLDSLRRRTARKIAPARKNGDRISDTSIGNVTVDGFFTQAVVSTRVGSLGS